MDLNGNNNVPELTKEEQSFMSAFKASDKFNKKSYSTNYLIDYNVYCQANHKIDADDKMKEKFIRDVVVHFRRLASPEEVINFFGIDDIDEKDMDDLINVINHRHYDITYIMTGNDPDHRQIMLRLTLTFNNGIILPN